jgi:hypothetical protein
LIRHSKNKGLRSAIAHRLGNVQRIDKLRVFPGKRQGDKARTQAGYGEEGEAKETGICRDRYTGGRNGSISAVFGSG